MVQFFPVWFAEYMPKYPIIQNRLPSASQDASSQRPKPSCLQLLRTRSRMTRKSTLAKVFTMITLNIVWIYAVHKRYSRSQQTAELDSTVHALQIREDQGHHVFRSAEPGLASRKPLQIRAYDSMSDDCVEAWVARHEWGLACVGTDLSEGLKVDGVWA